MKLLPTTEAEPSIKAFGLLLAVQSIMNNAISTNAEVVWCSSD